MTIATTTAATHALAGALAGAAIGAGLGAIIFGTVSMGIYYTGVDSDWFKVFLGIMVLIAVLVNNFIRKRVTENR